jgi:uncharacterized secreted protein with C-terminal beta-propeller domain
MDEEDGYLRMATTSNMWNRWWVDDPAPATNHVYVLDLQGHKLVQTGHLGDIAKGERIFAARFEGNRGYLVTFAQVDPLFTLDVSDPHAPRVVGELEVPGFSTYIHPIADDKILTIGVGGDENGANWRTQVSMFDVSDFAAPQLTDTEELVPEGSYGWSEALYEHKAFQYFAPKKMLAIPLSSYDLDQQNGWYTYQSKLELVNVDPDTGLSHRGTIDHSQFFNVDENNYWWPSVDIRRSIFMGDYIYAISDKGITVNALDDLSEVAEAPLPGWQPGPGYYYGAD